MADGVDFDIDEGELAAAADKITRQYLRAGTRTVSAVTRRAEQRLEALTRQTAGGKLWRAWQSRTYPRGDKPAREPVGEIWLKGTARTKGAVKFWTEPGQVRGRNVEWMPVPLPAAGKHNRQGILSPHEWEVTHPAWRLDLLWQDGKRPLLVAHKRVARRGDVQPRTGRVGGSGGISDGQPIFALVPFIPQRNAFAVKPVIAQAEREMAGEYRAQINRG